MNETTNAPRQQLTAVQQRAREIETIQGNMLADVEAHKTDIVQFLRGFGIDYEFFVSGLKVFMMRQAQTQPDFFTKLSNPASFMESLFRCAKDGLVPDGKEAAIAIYSGVATYMPMKDGLVKILWRTGQIRDLNDQIVTRAEYDQGHFDYMEGDDGYIRHKPHLDRKDTDEILAAYCVVHLTNGGTVREVVTQGDLKKIMSMSRSPATRSWPQQMARKSAIRRIMGKMPRTPEIAQVLAHDDENYDFNAFTAPEQSGVRERLPGRVEGEGFAHHKVEAALIRRPRDIDAVLEGDNIPETGGGTLDSTESHTESQGAPVEIEPEVDEDILQWASDFNGSLPSYTDPVILKARWEREIGNRKKLSEESAGLAKSLKDAVAARLKVLAGA